MTTISEILHRRLDSRINFLESLAMLLVEILAIIDLD